MKDLKLNDVDQVQLDEIKQALHQAMEKGKISDSTLAHITMGLLSFSIERLMTECPDEMTRVMDVLQAQVVPETSS